jgi:hypothetical protein
MTNGKRWTAALCLGLMTLFGGSRLWAADSKKQQEDEVRAKMKAEGWQEISEMVFEHQLGQSKVEHLGYGREGLAWTVGDLNQKLARLRKEYEIYPSANLAKTIADLTIQSAKTRRALWNFDQNQSKGLSSMTGAVAGASCSSICYSATADAYPLTSSQGVAAVADASFNSSCGYSGDTYAYAYSRATLNGTTTTITQSDPHTGTSVTSHAAASSNGGSVSGIACYSEASSYAQSTGLGISYSTSDTNSSCPVQACSVTISGTGYEYFTTNGCRTRTWTTSLSGCSGSTYQWYKNGVAISGATGSTYTQSVCASTGSFTLSVTVNGIVTDTHDVYVEYEPCECCNNQYICP